jgi:hypothetical protein
MIIPQFKKKGKQAKRDWRGLARQKQKGHRLVSFCFGYKL